MTKSDNLPEPNPGIMEIASYVPGKSAVPSGVKLFKLSANETPLGPSPAAKQAYMERAGSLEDYPDGSSSQLREAIAKAHGVNPANVLCGNGSDELLGLMAQCYLQPGDEAIYTEHGFLMYRIGILGAGATPIVAPEKNHTADVDAILARVTDATRLVYLANPNNPTGTYLAMSEVRRLHAGLPDSTILILDAAYAEYVRRNDYESGIELVAGSNNVVMTRTFSKIHGLAALRVGWVFGPDHIISVLDRMRGPFNVNAAAQAAAQEAVADREMVDKAVAHNDEWLTWTSEEMHKLGLRVTPSVGNFILIHFDAVDGKSAEGADAYLTQRGYVLRLVGGYGLPNSIRMTIGTEEACRGTVAALGEYLKA
ncbi:MAG: histidinol-phosphate transaminase [Rhizobiaceae bacterium]|nr:histidinol-phosphate transaminase [Rhizobiaceae bacterium]